LKTVKTYQQKHDYLNTVSHALGLVYALIGLPIIIYYACLTNEWRPIVGAVIFNLGMCTMYLTSTLYHSTNRKKVERRFMFRKFDHIAIYIFIAASYTPFIITNLRTSGSYIVLILLWLCVLVGVFFKLKFTGKYKLVSTLAYAFMGWLGVFLLGPIWQNLDGFTISLLLVGGAFYSIGAVFYSTDKIKYNHFIWHLFILVATFLHYLAVINSIIAKKVILFNNKLFNFT